MATTKGIDISVWQGDIDFSKVKAAGIEFVIIRAGYGRLSSQKDKQFETYYAAAKKAGLKVGAYWYSYAQSASEAKLEANACLACIKGKTFDMPVYFDLEDSTQTHLGKSILTAIAKAFCEVVKAVGYRAGVYANLNWFNNYLDYTALKKSYSIWLAQYNVTNQLECDIWQNSSTGKINGVSGNVDTNIIFNDNVIGKETTSGTTTTPKTNTNTNTNTSTKTNNKSNSAKAVSKPNVFYKVRTTKGKWLPEVKNLEDYAGLKGVAITDVAIKVSKGSIKYRVHIKGGKWLSYVTGYNVNDHINGYAGNGSVIDAIEIIYYTPDDVKKQYGYLYAKYRVSPLNGSYYSYQLDNETDNGQDGYAGTFGQAIDRLQIYLEK